MTATPRPWHLTSYMLHRDDAAPSGLRKSICTEGPHADGFIISGANGSVCAIERTRGIAYADASLIVRAVNFHAALVAALEQVTPENPFIGDELSGGPACIGCGSSGDNARHGDPDAAEHCTWAANRALLARIKEAK